MRFRVVLALLMLAVCCQDASAQYVPIVVRDLLGDAYQFEVAISETVASLKDKIVDKVHHPFELQRLVFDGRLLENDKKLSDYGIGLKSVVNLVVTTLEEEKPQIFVNFTNGRLISFEFRPTDTVDILKDKIASKKRISQADQRLSFRGSQLESGRLLASYGINDGCTVTLMGAALAPEPVQQIMVQMPGGGAMIVGIDSTDSVAQLKDKIRAQGGPAVYEQKLLFRGHALEDDRHLSQYGIQAGSIVEVSLASSQTNGFAGQLGHPVNIQVRTLAGRLIPVLVDPSNDTVARLKAKVRDAGGPSPPHQRYILNGVLLDDNRLLSSCGISEGTVLAISPPRQDPNPALTISVRVMGGRLLAFTVLPNDLVGSLKGRIASSEGGLPARDVQKLAFGHRVLADDKTLAYYNIAAGSIVDLLAPPVAGQAMLQIFVDSSPGTTFVFDVRPSDTVANLKERIAQLGLHPQVEQQLFLEGKMLDDASKLADCGVRGWSTLNLVLIHGKRYVPQINVRLSSGQTVAIEIGPSETVASLRAKIASAGATTNAQLQFNGQLLEDWRSLAECGVYPGSTVTQITGASDAPSVMRIFVQTVGGDRIALYPSSTDNVATLKNMLRTMGVWFTNHNLLLYYNNIQLKDPRRLVEYGIQNESTITLTLAEHVAPSHSYNPAIGYEAQSIQQNGGGYIPSASYDSTGSYYTPTGFDPTSGHAQTSSYNHAAHGYSSASYTKQVVVRGADGNSIIVNVEPHDMVVDLKRKIMSATGWHPVNQRLSIAGMALDNDYASLSLYGIQSGSIVNLTVDMGNVRQIFPAKWHR